MGDANLTADKIAGSSHAEPLSIFQTIQQSGWPEILLTVFAAGALIWVGKQVWNVALWRSVEARNKELIAQNARLETILENVSDGVSVFDENHRLTYMNSKALRLLDIPFDRFRTGDPIEKLFQFNANRGEYGPGDPSELAEKRLQLVLKSRRHDFERTRPNGNSLRIRGNPMPDGGFVTLYTDITNQKAIENELIERGRLLESLLDSIPAYVSITDENGRIQLANKSAEKLLGAAEENIIGFTGQEVMGLDGPSQVDLATHEVLRSGVPVLNREISHDHDPKRTSIINSVPVRNDNGDIEYVLNTAWETTDIKLAEQEIAAQAKLLQTIMDHVPISIAIRDPEGRFIAMNKYGAEAANVSTEEIPGKTLREVAGLDQTPVSDKVALQVAQTGRPIKDLDIHHFRDPNRSFSLRSVPVLSTSGNVESVVTVMWEMTKQKMAEQAALARLRLLQSVVDSIPAIISIRDEDGKAVLVNKTAAELYGRTVDECLGKTMEESFGIKRNLVSEGHVANVLKTGESIKNIEVPLAAEPGGMALGSFLPIPSEDGEGKLILKVLLDITDKKNAEREALEHSKLLQSILDHAPVGIMVRDPEGRIRLANEHAAERIGKPASELVGKTNQEALGLVEPSHTDKATFDVLESGIPIFGREFAHNPDPTRTSIMNVVPIRNEEGDIEYILNAAWEITDLKEAEKESAARLQLLQNVIDKLPAFVTMRDLNKRAVLVNESAAEAFGRPIEECVGKTVQEMFGEDHVEPAEAFYDQVLKTGEGVGDVELTYATLPDRIVSGHFLPVFDEAGTLEGVLSVTRDITDKKQNEDRLAQTAKLSTLGQMAAGMVHELSQPLSIIKLASEGTLLRIKRGRSSPEYQTDQFSRIDNQASRMSEIIDHIRIFSRKESVDYISFEISSVIENAIKIFQVQLDSNLISLDYRPLSSEAFVEGRPFQIEQVLLNLLNNAHDAISAHCAKSGSAVGSGRIKVFTELVDRGRTIEIDIEDNGGGVADDQLEKIFDPFFTTKEPGHGTGLGLSVSYGIITNMSGEIRAMRTGDGMRFSVFLPCSTVQDNAGIDQSDDTARTAVGRDGNGLSVLVVDDEVEIRELIGDHLQACGFRVNFAGDGDAALKLMESDLPAIVLSDIKMPNMGGRTLADYTRALYGDVPFIFITGEMITASANPLLLDDDLFTFVKKPVVLSELEDLVFKMIKRN